MTTDTTAATTEITPLRDVIAHVSGRTGLEKGIVQAVISAMTTLVAEEVMAGRGVDIGREFGYFHPVTLKPRKFYTPPTDDMTHVSERRKIRFVATTAALKTLPPLGSVNKDLSKEGRK